MSRILLLAQCGQDTASEDDGIMSSVTFFPSLLFAVAMLSAALYALAASGHFPRRGRVSDGSDLASAVLWGANVAAIVALAGALAAAWLLVPWYAMVIFAGLAVLVAPVTLQFFPDVFVDSACSLLAFAGTLLVSAAALVWLSQALPDA